MLRNLIIRAGLDASGIKDGTKKAQNALTGFQQTVKRAMGAIGIAIGAVAIVSFLKDCVKASMELTNAMTGVKSIAEGQGRSFALATKFLNEYVSDGLIPATNAATAYKNLAMRGYDDEQIKTTLTALKDSASYGRQASLTLGEAVSSATEGLKNENSILVDNAGVTKNVSMMWKDYAKSIGVGVESLTKQQKIQAEVNGIIEETRFQTGDAAKISDSYSGQVLRLGFNFNKLKVAIGDGIIPILQMIVPAINTIIVALTKVAMVFSQVIMSIFGKQAKQQQNIASTAGSAAKETEGLATATDKAGKAAKGALSSIDELNVLNQSTGEGSDSVGGAADIAGTENDIGSVADVTIPDTISPQVQNIVNNINLALSSIQGYIDEYFSAPFTQVINTITMQIETFKGTLSNIWSDIELLGEPLKTWFDNDFTPYLQTLVTTMGNIVGGLLSTFNLVFADIWDLIYPMIEKFITVVLPMGTQLHTEFVKTFETLLDNVKMIFDKLWSEGIQPALDIIKNIWLDMVDSIAAAWNKWGAPIFENMRTAINKLGETLKIAWETTLKPVWDNLMSTVDKIWKEHLQPLVDNFLDFIGEFVNGALRILNEFIFPLVNAFLEVFGPSIAGVMNFTVDKIGSTIAKAIDSINKIIDTLKNIVKFITGVFTTDWGKAWQDVVDKFKGIFDTILEIVKNVVNSVVDLINNLISTVTSGLNFIIDKMNSLSFDAPDWLGGGHFGISIPPIQKFSIPRLAKGGLAYSETLAVVGDNIGATSDPEVISPLSKLTQLINSEGQISTLAYIAQILEDIRAKDTGVYIDGDAIGKASSTYDRSISKRIGFDIVGV